MHFLDRTLLTPDVINGVINKAYGDEEKQTQILGFINCIEMT